MVEVVTGFVELLRRAGLRVSTAEAIDAARALGEVGLDDRAAVRAALAATLVKRADDRARFDELFALYFERGAAAVAAAAPGDPSLPVRVVAAARAAGLDGIRSPLQVGAYTLRVLDALAAGGAGDAPGGGGEGSLDRGGPPEPLRAAVRAFVDDELRRRQPELPRRLAEAALADRAVAALTPAELATLDVEVQRLARRLATRLPAPRPARRRGRLDVRATLRGSWATGGVPFHVRRRHRPVRRPRLIVLCDVSDSVRRVATFFLALVHALTRRYDRVHTFVFVAELGDATRLFRSCDVGRAIEAVQGGRVPGLGNPWQPSDYGRVLAALADQHLGKIGRRTTVLVLGDGRTNDRPPRADRLAAIRRRAHRVVWLNPEPPAAWGWGDSAIPAYAPHCDRVLPVGSLAALRDAITTLEAG